ncbi:MAG: N-acetyltransferase [Tolypothrix carrinoi HA7290-LM1]|jgi:putative acetyltransferase|nr:N-acetyltransferase [Tolypothrix carrinoi HA7290-LM1]
MDIRCEGLADYAAIAEVNILAFGQENEAKLIEEIRCSQGYIPELSLVAEIDGAIVGHILFSYIDLIGEESLQVLSLAPMAVLPQFQGRGIGSALVEAGLEKANALKEALVIVLGHPHFYTRFGFEASVNYKITSPFPVPEDVFMVKPLQNYQEKYQGKVVYPPAFSAV